MGLKGSIIVLKVKKLFVVSVGVFALGGGVSQASMLDQLIYNVAGQATNAAGARLGDEIYYGSSRSAPQKTHHVKHRKHKKKRYVAPRDTPEMKIQRALSSLGFYRGRIDGEINSFETRSAIKDLNIAYGISNNASLQPEAKNSLIFLGTLFDFDRYLISRGGGKKTKGKKIQVALKIHGFYFSKIDGDVGPGTRKAIAEYKSSMGGSYGGALDFEEEYQLVSSAKAKNDKNIEDTIGSIKVLGVKRQMAQQPTAVQPRQAAPASQMHAPQVVAPAQQVVQPMQTAPVAQPTAQQVQAPTTSSMPNAASIEMYTDGQ
jgi:peptidoglycan hydrolase-like protein with peptidoglycan-binding domain